jgi:hypothetical protein
MCKMVSMIKPVVLVYAGMFPGIPEVVIGHIGTALQKQGCLSAHLLILSTHLSTTSNYGMLSLWLILLSAVPAAPQCQGPHCIQHDHSSRGAGTHQAWKDAAGERAGFAAACRGRTCEHR